MEEIPAWSARASPEGFELRQARDQGRGGRAASSAFLVRLAVTDALLVTHFWTELAFGLFRTAARRPAHLIAAAFLAGTAASAARRYVFPQTIELTPTLDRVKAIIEEYRLEHRQLPETLEDAIRNPPYRYARTSEGYKLIASKPGRRFGTRGDVVEHVTTPTNYRIYP